MSGRRSRFEIYVDVLAEIKGGTIKPTKIMYGANLSWKPLQKILENLVTQGLIVEIRRGGKDKRTKVEYGITEKGENVLRYYKKAKSLIHVFPSRLS